MKNRIILLMFLWPALAQAQITTVTEAQKQQALQHVTEFCSLLERWSDGERTLDTRIYALCSGNDCSAFDDVSTQKETTLRNYLLGIQKRYPKSLSMKITSPILAKCSVSYAPEVEFATNLSFVNGNYGLGNMIEIPSAFAKSYRNAYITFKVNQTIPNLEKEVIRLIVYDVKAKKISAFVTGTGTYISYLEGLNMMINGNYKEAIHKFEEAASNERASLKKECYHYAFLCSGLLVDLPSIMYYVEKIGDPFLSKYYCAVDKLVKGKYLESLTIFEDCEKQANQSTQYRKYLPSIYYECALINSILCSYPNDIHHGIYLSQSISYFRKAIEYGETQAAVMFWAFYTVAEDEIDKNVMSKDEVMNHITWAAEKGNSQAIFIMINLEKPGSNNLDKTIALLEKSANNGDSFCMAWLGRLLLQKGDEGLEKGKVWLKKALEGNQLEEGFKIYETWLGGNFWPCSRQDIMELLNKPIGANSTSSSYTESPATSLSNHSPTYHPQTTTYHYRTKRHRPFNHAQDEYGGGFTIGYIRKQWEYTYEGGEKECVGMFDSDYLKGIQVGFRLDPQFGAGFV